MDIPLMMDTGSDREVGTGYAEAINGAGTPPRRQYPIELKRRIVEETFAPEASVAQVARRHGVNDNLVFEWRKLYREGRLWHGKPAPAAKPAMGLPGLIRVGVIDHDGIVHPATAEPPAPPAREARTPSPGRPVTAGRIEIELPNGFKVRVEGEVDDRALTRVLTAIRDLA